MDGSTNVLYCQGSGKGYWGYEGGCKRKRVTEGGKGVRGGVAGVVRCVRGEGSIVLDKVRGTIILQMGDIR